MSDPILNSASAWESATEMYNRVSKIITRHDVMKGSAGEVGIVALLGCGPHDEDSLGDVRV